MDLKLSVQERIKVLNVLDLQQIKGNILLISVVNKLRDNLSLSEEEIKEFEAVFHDNGIVTWNKTKAKDKLITFSDSAYDLIKKGLKILHEKDELPESFFSTWLIFFTEEETNQIVKQLEDKERREAAIKEVEDKRKAEEVKLKTKVKN